MRTGAEDELTQINTNIVSPPMTAATQTTPMSSMKHKEINLPSTSHTNMKSSTMQDTSRSNEKSTSTVIIDLKPSKKLAQPVDYPPLHIFVNI